MVLYPLHDTELTPDQRDTFRRVQPQLLQALFSGDLTDVKTCWDTIVHDGLIGLFRPRQWKDLSNAIAPYGTDTPQRWDKTAELAAIDQMAIEAGARGYDDGLCARMRYYISINETGPAIRLFTRTCVVNKQRDQVYQGPHPTQEIYQQLVKRHGRRSMVQPSTVSHALTVFAQKDDFSLALRAFLHPTVMAQTVFDHGALCRVVPTTSEDPFLTEKATRYSHRLHLAVLLQLHPDSFSRFVSRLNNKEYSSTLMRLLYRVLDELNHPESFITYRAEDVSDTKPVLLDQDSSVWGMLLYAAMLREHPQLVKKLQESIRKAGFKIPGHVLGQMLRALAELGKFDEARKLWDTLARSDDVAVDVDACTWYVSVTYDARGEHAAFTFLDEVEDGVAREVLPPATQPVYNAVLTRLLRAGKTAEARALVERMKGAGIAPDIASYNIFLRHFVSTGDAAAAEQTFKDLSAAGLSGNIESFCLLLAALSSISPTGSGPVLPVVFKHMKAHGFEGMDDRPQHHVRMIKYLTAPNTALAPEAALALAWDVMKYADTRGWGLWNFVFVLVLAAVERHAWADPALPQTYRAAARELAARHLTVPLFRHTIVCVDIVRACLENPEPGAARRAWDYYREHMSLHTGEVERAPNNAVWMPLLNGLRKRGEWSLADELVQEIEGYGEILPVSLQRQMTLVRLREDGEVDDIESLLKASQEQAKSDVEY